MSSGFTRQSLPELITTIRNDLYARLDADSSLYALRRNDPEVYSRVIAGATHIMLGYMENMAKNILPDLADETWLTRHGNMKKCYRKQPTATKGFIRWIGVGDGITVPLGTQIKRQQDQITYTVTAETASKNNLLIVPVICEVTGKIGNCDDGTNMSLITPIAGLSFSCFADGLITGTDIEDLELFRARIIERWYNTPQGGNDNDYVVWAKEVEGIGNAWCYRHWMGTGTVGLMIATNDLDNPVPSDDLIDKVRQYVEPKAPVAGSSLFVFAPIPKKVNFDLSIYPDTSQVRYQIEAELKAFLQREGRPQSTLWRSRINEVISSSYGEYKHELLLPNDDIRIEKNQIAVFGGITWS